MPAGALIFTLKVMSSTVIESALHNQSSPSAAAGVKTIRLIRGGKAISLSNVPPSRMLLEVLREDLGLTGTKEGCGEGDCGACTVVVAAPDADTPGGLRFRAINSCIRPAHAIDGMALWTVEDLADADGKLHPAQQAMLENHASQCGFCTPGFVMSLFGMYQNHVCRGKQISRELAQEELSGNLCRCTGYRPILDAAKRMDEQPLLMLDTADLLQKLERIADIRIGLEANLAYKLPLTLNELLQARADHPTAQIVAGCTDVGLWVTKRHMQLEHVIDVTRTRELLGVTHEPNHLRIGAAVSLVDAFSALLKLWPQLHTFTTRFAGLPVRNSATLGGNIANGSPIGDSMPLLIALRASVVLTSLRGERELLLEDLYTGYRQNVMAADEVLAWIRVPKPGSPHPCLPSQGEGEKPETAASPRPARFGVPSPAGGGLGWGLPDSSSAIQTSGLRIYKISKRYDDDISAVCLAINLHIDGGVVVSASLGVGGVAATPVRAIKTEASLLGRPWTTHTVQQAMAVLRAEFSPISDMRASGGYRSQVLGNLLQRYWLESKGMQQIRLEAFDVHPFDQDTRP